MPDRLLLGRRLLEARPDVLFCCSDFGLRDAERPDRHHGLAGWHDHLRPWDEILGPGVRYSEIAPLPPGRADFRVHVGSLYDPLLEGGYVAAQTLLVRREEAGDALHFGEDLPTFEDQECAARLARAGRVAYLDCETAWQWGHHLPRLTHADAFQTATARLTIVERIWAKDPAFLAHSELRVSEVLRRNHIIRAKWFIRRGRNAEARAELRRAGGGPMAHRLMAAMPDLVTRGFFRARELVYGRRRARGIR
jgi:hypothetical protein